MDQAPIRAIAPGRICLFGEHQDYLGLPVIAMAVDRHFQIDFWPTADAHFLIETPDLPGSTAQSLDIHAAAPRHNEDYCWGIGQTLLEEGFQFPRGGRAVFRSNIPFRAGCSSSSAMSAAWMRLLLEIGEHPERAAYIADREAVAYLVYRGEKEKFRGAGGMMDQYSCYLGGLIYVYPEGYPGAPPLDHSTPLRQRLKIPYGVKTLPTALNGLILIDSGQPKDTQGILSSVGDRARRAVAAAQAAIAGFDLRRTSWTEFEAAAATAARAGQIDDDARLVVSEHLRNRDLCQQGLQMLQTEIDTALLGQMLNEEHRILAQTLQISTERIDQLHALCLRNGARGGKINGSGGGGTMFCLSGEQTKDLGAALDQAGVRWFQIQADPGARIV